MLSLATRTTLATSFIFNWLKDPESARYRYLAALQEVRRCIYLGYFQDASVLQDLQHQLNADLASAKSFEIKLKKRLIGAVASGQLFYKPTDECRIIDNLLDAYCWISDAARPTVEDYQRHLTAILNDPQTRLSQSVYISPSPMTSPGVIVCNNEDSYIYGLTEPYWVSYRKVWQVRRLRILPHSISYSPRTTRLADASEALEFAHGRWPGLPVWFFRSPLIEGIPLVEGQLFMGGLSLEAQLAR
jgi:hypothetical protein